MKTWLLTLAFALLLTSWADALEITSLAPSVAAPGDRVTITGGPFPTGAAVLLGEATVPPDALGDRRMVFTVPPLPPGEYALGVALPGQVSPRPFLLRVVEPTPTITALSPDLVESCNPAPVRIVVSGNHFVPGATVLVNGSQIPSERQGTDSLSFTLPDLADGIHPVQVANPGGHLSLPYSLTVNGHPEITAVFQGADHVNNYEVIIEGNNFLYTSVLVVDGRRINPHITTELRTPSSDSVSYVGCDRIIYYRHPFSREPKQVSLKVVNPGGTESPVYFVNIP